MRKLAVLLFVVLMVILVSCNSDEDKTNKIGNTCTIILHSNNGNDDIIFYGMQGDFITLPTPFKLNHSFAYWFDDKNNMYAAGNQFAYSSNLVLELYGRWAVKIDLPDGYDDVFGYSELPVMIPEIVSEDVCGFWVMDNGDKLYPGKITCPFDNFSLHLEQHVFDQGVVTKEATHTTDGELTYTCTVCEKTKKEILPADLEAHKWDSGVVTTEATCERNGIKTYTCTECNMTMVKIIPMTTDHSFGNWIVRTEATSTAEGEKYRTCTVCGHEETAVIPMLSYAVGDIGPAGGYIFYDCDADNDKGNPDGLISTKVGWRYLEAAPADLKVVGEMPTVDSSVSGYSSASAFYVFGYHRKLMDDGRVRYLYVNGTTTYQFSNCTKTAIGTGKKNTELLVSAMGTTTYSSDTSITGNYAARLCDTLSYTVGGVTYDDWFLPSKDELNLMYTNLKEQGRGDFAYDEYWSSSEYDYWGGAIFAWKQSFNYGGKIDYNRRYYFRVRAVRAF